MPTELNKYPDRSEWRAAIVVIAVAAIVTGLAWSTIDRQNARVPTDAARPQVLQDLQVTPWLAAQ